MAEPSTRRTATVSLSQSMLGRAYESRDGRTWEYVPGLDAEMERHMAEQAARGRRWKSWTAWVEGKGGSWWGGQTEARINPNVRGVFGVWVAYDEERGTYSWDARLSADDRAAGEELTRTVGGQKAYDSPAKAYSAALRSVKKIIQKYNL